MEIFQYDFMIRAFEAGIATAVIAPTIGMFLVVRRYAFLADALAHVSLLGVAVGLVFQANLFVAALVTSLAAAFGLHKMQSLRYLQGDAILSLLLSSSLALAVVLVSIAGGFSVDLISFLFGSLTTVTTGDVRTILMLSGVVLAITYLFYRGLFLVSFNPEIAAADGLNVSFLNVLLISLAAVTVSLSIRIVGVLLIGALMVIPVITAFQFRRSFKQTLGFAIVFSVLSVILGLFAAYYLDVPSGGAIVLVALLFFVFSIVRNRMK